MKKSESSLDSFIETLTDTGQEHVVAALKSDEKEKVSTSAKQSKGLDMLGNNLSSMCK